MKRVIYTTPSRNEYSHSAIPTYNPKLGSFVQGPLAECMRAAYPGVSTLHYVEDMVETTPLGDKRSYRQAVIVTFANGYRKVANVEGDSEWGCIEDVMRCILR